MNARYLNKSEKPICLKKLNLKKPTKNRRKTDRFSKQTGTDFEVAANLGARAGRAARGRRRAASGAGGATAPAGRRVGGGGGAAAPRRVGWLGRLGAALFKGCPRAESRSETARSRFALFFLNYSAQKNK